MLWLTDLIVPKFSIHGFWTYVWATIVVWVVNIVVDAILSPVEAGARKPLPQPPRLRSS
jgi:uncharacterized membrane protein YvlD (DUF360 family)